MKLKRQFLCLMAALYCFFGTIPANADDIKQPTVNFTKAEGTLPSGSAHIIKYYIDEAAAGSGYETGSLHIVYSDNTEIVEKIPPKQKSTEKETVENQEGIQDVKLAADKQVIGWTENYDNCCTSYAVPQVLSLYQSGKTIMHIQQGQMIWFWMFADKGKQVAAVWGAIHGPEIGDYQLYDIKTGSVIAEVFDDENTQSLKDDAPEWAKNTEKEMRRQK